MAQSLITVGVFLLLLMCVPWALKWAKQRGAMGLGGQDAAQAQFISALAVGPQQRVVVVEVGPQGSRTRLTLGVTPTQITCLHTEPVDAGAAPAGTSGGSNLLGSA